MRFVRLAAVAAAGVLALGLASCSSTGGKPASNGSGMGAGQANTPRMTVAMITHEVPGDSFWDLIRKGAQAAADKDNIELRYSNDPEAPAQANLVQSAIDSKVDGIAVTLAKPDAMAPAVKAAEAAGIPVVAFNSGFDNFKADGRPGVLRPGREAGRRGSGREAQQPTAPRRSSASSRSRVRSHSNHVAPESSRASRGRARS